MQYKNTASFSGEYPTTRRGSQSGMAHEPFSTLPQLITKNGLHFSFRSSSANAPNNLTSLLLRDAILTKGRQTFSL